MSKLPRLSLTVILTTAVAVLTLLGFFVPAKTEQSLVKAIQGFQWLLVSWAIIIAAFAVILGVLNLWSVHIKRFFTREPGFQYSPILVASSIAVLAIGLLEGPSGSLTMDVFVWIISPLQAALTALLLFALTYSAYRLLRLRRQLDVFIFLFAALVVLIGRVPLPDWSDTLTAIHDKMITWLAIPGLRGLLMGVALGTTIMVLRLLTGVDRPFNPADQSDE